MLIPAFIPRTTPILGPTGIGSNGQALLSDGAGGTSWGSAGVTAHSGLSGLTSGDDHTQYIYNAPGSSTRNVIQPSGAAIVPFVVKGAASQSGNLLNVQRSDGTNYLALSKWGKLTIACDSTNENDGLVCGSWTVTQYGANGDTLWANSINGRISFGGQYGHILKRSATNPQAVNGDAVLTPLWISTVNGGSFTDNSRFGTDLNLSAGAGGTPPSGTLVGGDAGNVNVYVGAGGSGSGGQAAGADGALRVINGSSVTVFSVSHSKLVTLADAANISVGTSTGTKLGTATSQKLGFWNATPVIQPTTAGAAATLVGGGGTALTDSDTFDGYTLKQVVKALRTIGLLA